MFYKFILFIFTIFILVLQTQQEAFAINACPSTQEEGMANLSLNIDSLELYGALKKIKYLERTCTGLERQKVLVNVLSNDGNCRGEKWFFIKSGALARQLEPGDRFSFLINKSECIETDENGENTYSDSKLIILKMTGE